MLTVRGMVNELIARGMADELTAGGMADELTAGGMTDELTARGMADEVDFSLWIVKAYFATHGQTLRMWKHLFGT
uniref:Uncharacterized protein n=1 Tax=Cannabis sativa TaxID=3483 RepID=A0A803QQ62_CANSA